MARHLALLARQNLPLCITLNDPILAARAEQVPDTGRQLDEKVFAALRVDERAAVLDELRRAGVLTVDAPADRLTVETINRYVELRERALL